MSESTHLGPVVVWSEAGVEQRGIWRSEAQERPPARLSAVDDTLRADAALRRLREGEGLVYVGDFRNARQLLASVERRLASRPPKPAPNLREAFHRGRARKASEHAVLSRLLVSLDAGYRLRLRHAPETATACAHAWGPPSGENTVVALRELLGVMGAEEWRRVGLEVPGLPGRIHPHYGVFTPTRGDYPTLLAQAPSPRGKRVFDVGTGTGVLGFLLLEKGAASVVGTDAEPRAVACANENAAALGYADRFSALERDGFPDGEADLIVSNPPWLPATPRTPIDRAIYDPEHRFLDAFLAGVPGHLAPGGEAWLIVSDLPERLGLRPENFLTQAFARHGLTVLGRLEVAPTHPRTQDRDDPLHAARAAERTCLWRLSPRSKT